MKLENHGIEVTDQIFFDEIRNRGLFKKGTFVFFVCLGQYLCAQNFRHLDKPKFAGVPIFSYNKSFGGIFGAMGCLFFSIDKTRDTISPASNIGLGAIYTTNKTWFGFGFAKLYYSEDLFRTTVAGGTGTFNFQFFYQNTWVPGAFIDYSTAMNFIYAEQLIRFYGRVYTGLAFTYYNVSTSFEEILTDSSARNYLAIGIPLTVDSRDNVQNPAKGWFANARLNRFSQKLGSATDFTKLDTDASYFLSVGKEIEEKKRSAVVLASKVSISTALGAVPFEAQTVVGGNVLRGYSEGKYRGDQVYAVQTEFRYNFFKKWGAVVFTGVATPVTEGVSWTVDQLLPAGGAGIRYMMIPDLQLNVGLEAAAGKGDYGVYFRIGEAF